MKLAALAFGAALLLPPQLAATAQPAPPAPREAVLERFAQLVDRGEARDLFGLPADRFWRRDGGLDLALLADDHAALRPLLEGAAEPFVAPSGRSIAVAETGPAEIANRRAQELAPRAELVIVIAPRPALARFAADNGFNLGMLANFELGSWPFVFNFQEDARRRGLVLLADDEPARSREAAFILATVWSLGAVTLGPELSGLIADSAAGPRLTALGDAVFRLFFHPGLETGMPIADAVSRAAALLPQ